MFFTGQEQHQVASTKSQFLIGCYCSQASCSCILLRPKCDSLSCCRKLSRPAATAGFKAYNSAAAALRRHATLEPCPIGGCAEPRRELFEPSAAPRRESRSCEAARTPKPQQNPIEEHSKFPENSLRPSECPESQKEERERGLPVRPRRSPASRPGARSLRTCGPGSLAFGAAISALRKPRNLWKWEVSSLIGRVFPSLGPWDTGLAGSGKSIGRFARSCLGPQPATAMLGEAFSKEAQRSSKRAFSKSNASLLCPLPWK